MLAALALAALCPTQAHAIEGRFRIHYVGYEAAWDEWVPSTRIRFPEKPAPAR